MLSIREFLLYYLLELAYTCNIGNKNIGIFISKLQIQNFIY